MQVFRIAPAGHGPFSVLAAVYVPTPEGHSLLLSPDEPDAFLNALQMLAR
jgi:hypothetical protein